MLHDVCLPAEQEVGGEFLKLFLPSAARNEAIVVIRVNQTSK